MGKSHNPVLDFHRKGGLSALRTTSTFTPAKVKRSPFFIPELTLDSQIVKDSRLQGISSDGIVNSRMAANIPPISSVVTKLSDAIELEQELLASEITSEASFGEITIRGSFTSEGVTGERVSIYGDLEDSERVKLPLEIVTVEKLHCVNKGYTDKYFCASSFVYDPVYETWIPSGRYGKQPLAGVGSMMREPFKQESRARDMVQLIADGLSESGPHFRGSKLMSSHPAVMTADELHHKLAVQERL